MSLFIKHIAANFNTKARRNDTNGALSYIDVGKGYVYVPMVSYNFIKINLDQLVIYTSS